MLQPLEADAQDKSKHKFMVQSMYASDDAEDVEQLVIKFFFKFVIGLRYILALLCVQEIAFD